MLKKFNLPFISILVLSVFSVICTACSTTKATETANASSDSTIQSSNDGLHIKIYSFATAEECDYAMKNDAIQEEIRKGMFEDDDRIKQYVMHSLNDFQIVVDENHPAPESVW